MKAEELMIGDWVRIKEPDRYAGALATIKSLRHHKEDECAYFCVFIQGHGYGLLHREVCNEDLEPVQLTEEILEKNGFIKFIEKRYILLDKENNWKVSVYLPTEDTSNSMFLSIRDNYNDVKITISYVHQLQHALKPCDIEKEIKL